MRYYFKVVSILLRARLAETVRAPVAFALTFVFPAILLLCLGLVFYQGHPFERRPIALVCAASPGADLQARLAPYHASVSLQPMSEAQAQAALSQALVEVIVRCVSNSPSAVHAPAAAQYELSHSPAGALTALALESLLRESTPLPLALHSRSPQRPLRGAYVAGLLPGTIAFTVLFAGLYGLGPPLLRYRRKNILAKLSLTPLPFGTLVLSQILARVLLTLGQCVVLLSVGLWFWNGPSLSPPALFALSAVVAVGTVCFCALGLLVACAVSAEDTLTDLIASSATPLVLLSGAFFSLTELPPWLAMIAKVLPSTQLVTGARAALTHDYTAVSTAVTGLSVWSLVALVLGLKWFRPTQ